MGNHFEYKLEITKEVLGADNWKMRTESFCSKQILNKKGKIIMEIVGLNKICGTLYYEDEEIWKDIRAIFGYDTEEIKQLLKILINERFDYGVQKIQKWRWE